MGHWSGEEGEVGHWSGEEGEVGHWSGEEGDIDVPKYFKLIQDDS